MKKITISLVIFICFLMLSCTLKEKSKIKTHSEKSNLNYKNVERTPEIKYVMNVKDIITTQWRKIEYKKNSCRDCKADVAFTITSDGNIIDINIEKTSEKQLYDDMVIRFVEGLMPLPQFTKDISKPNIKMLLTIRSS